MTVTVETFRAAYPEFASTTDALVERYVGEASLYVNECWGSKQDLGTMLYVAHSAQVETDRIAAGIDASGRGTTSIGSGTHKVTPGSTDKNAAGHPWAKTRYGRLFWDMKQRYTGSSIYAL